MTDQRISDILASSAGKPLLSFEFFPPKDDSGMDLLRKHAEQLLTVAPDFVTVTYGAGGSTRDRTLRVCAMLREIGLDPVMPHLTCVGSSRDELNDIADELHALGHRNIMTLRGDPPKGQTTFEAAENGLRYASELVELLMARHPDFCCGVAAYPEMHPEAASPASDLENLKRKLDAGAAFATTQLFFDNRVYVDFLEACSRSGISKPVLPGLLPPLSLKQVQRMCSMCKTHLPSDLESRLKDAEGDPEKSEQAGIEWVAEQIRDLLAGGVPGIHLYVLNRSRAALSRPIIDAIQSYRG